MRIGRAAAGAKLTERALSALPIRSRHARLVVGTAQVWCQLMLETLADPDAPWCRSES